MPVETEIKFRIADLSNLQQRLESSGFHLQTPRTFESNVLYDTPDREMRARTEILRIRNYAGRWTLTHKRPPDRGDNSWSTAGDTGSGENFHKHRIETETEISDGDALAEVFRSIGLVPSFLYEKWRAEYADGQGHCVIDETPIGDYAELEGPSEWIERITPLLGVDRSQYITLSYGRLFDVWREEHASASEDMTFEAVAQVAGADRKQ